MLCSQSKDHCGLAYIDGKYVCDCCCKPVIGDIDFDSDLAKAAVAEDLVERRLMAGIGDELVPLYEWRDYFFEGEDVQPTHAGRCFDAHLAKAQAIIDKRKEME